MHGGDLLPRKRSLKCNFEGFYPIDLIFYSLTDRFILRYALVSLFRIFKFWRENDVILLAPIFCLSVKTSLVNFSKVRCCVNFKTENIIELS
jgi:hypothetical protein